MSTVYYADNTSTSAEAIKTTFSKINGFTLIQKSKSDLVIVEKDNELTLHLDQCGYVTSGTRYAQTNEASILEILVNECGLQFISEYEIDDHLKSKNASNLLVLYRSETDKILGELKAAELGVKPVFVEQKNNQIDEDYLDSIRLGTAELETWHCQNWWISAQVSENAHREIYNFTEENSSISVYRS